MTDTNILVSICCDSFCLGIKTYSRENGRHGRFLLRRELIEELLSEKSPGEIYDSDMNSFAAVRLRDNSLLFQIYWLYEYSEQVLTGLRQSFTLSIPVVKDLLENSIVTRSYLCKPLARSAKVDHLGAASAVRNVLPDKRKKRALSKAMRDAFQWPGEHVVLHNDGGCNFFFTTQSTFAICGGLIMHEGTKNGYPAVYYSVHT